MSRRRARSPFARLGRDKADLSDPLRRRSFEPAAGTDGRPLPNDGFRQNRLWTMRSTGLIEKSQTERRLIRDRSRLAELRQQRDLAIVQYFRVGELSLKDLGMLFALWVHGKDLRVHARETNVSPASISDRIKRMEESGRAAKFIEWWTLKNARRRGTRTNALLPTRRRSTRRSIRKRDLV